MTAIDTAEPTRRRLIASLFAGNAISSTGYIGIATVATLIAEQITGSTAVSGVASTVGTLGVALGAAALSWTSLRAGRRPTFAAGYALAVVGSVLAGMSIAVNSLSLLLVGMLTMGFGRSVGQLARYAAGDLRSAEHRASAISLIVWASTIGAVFGPLLIGPTSAMASAAGFDELIGPVAVAVGGFGLASILMFISLRPEPLSLVVREDGHDAETSAQPLSSLLRSRTVQLSVLALVTAQIVMVFVMVMTPIHIRDNDGSLAIVGWVMMAHTLGMFAIAPVTGFMVDRFGPRRMILIATAVLMVACGIAAAATDANTPLLIVGLFLLGVGWNFGFVAGSTLLQTDLSVPNRLKLQGFADSTAWVSAALAAGLSGVVVANTSYATLAIVGSFLALTPLLKLRELRGV